MFGGFLVVGLVRQALTRDAAVARADVLARAGKVEEALAELRSAMAQRPDGRRAQAVAMILFNATSEDDYNRLRIYGAAPIDRHVINDGRMVFSVGITGTSGNQRIIHFTGKMTW